VSWFAVDDRFSQHRKVMTLRRSSHYAEAVALWTLAGSWACGQDVERFTGQAPVDVLASLGVVDWQQALDALVLVGLWDCNGEAVTFHDWDAWNGTGSREHRSKEQSRKRSHAYRLRQCQAGQHSKDCPATDLSGAPRQCPKRAKRKPRDTASRDAGTGRDGTGRVGGSSQLGDQTRESALDPWNAETVGGVA